MSKTIMYDVFLSYSSKDKKTVHALAERLKLDGLRVWLDAWKIEPGDLISLKIQHGLEKSRTLILCMSPNYFESEWGTLEHHTLLFRDPTNTNRRFVPLLIADCALPYIIAQFAFIDWRMPSNEAYDRLMACCRGEDLPILTHTPFKSEEEPFPSAHCDVNQVAAICYRGSGESVKFLLIKSTGRRWIFPKGNRRKSEKEWEAAKREAFEEAGVMGEVDNERLTTFEHHKRELKETGIILNVAAYLLQVKSQPHKGEKHRNPTWFSKDEAINALAKGQEFKYAHELNRVIEEACAKIG